MFIAPILQDKELSDNSNLGVLMCGSEAGSQNFKAEPESTVFVNKEWLSWVLKGQESGFELVQNVPTEQIYGQIPAWPDSFFEFLMAVVQTNSTFQWNRHKAGYLMLTQKF
jgi:hypothetical protein